MTATRKPSLYALIDRLAASGRSVRATLPDGTVIEVLTAGSLPVPIPSKIEQDAMAGEHALNGTFSKGVRKPRQLQGPAR